jgi:predicted dehydrogenase
MLKRKLRAGMIGGGIGAFIGPVHRSAATMDGLAEYVAGAFSSDPDKSRRSGEALFLAPDRVYGDYRKMAEREAGRPAGERLDYVSIVTPNVLHFDVARTFLEAGFNVVCDKPMTYTLEQALELRKVVQRTKKVFALTHNYTGYPMVKQARQMVRDGVLGRVNKIVVEYPQGWLSGRLDGESAALAIWRMDPRVAGAAGCMGDIGTHAENLARAITGLQIEELCADLTSFIPGNELDDDGSVLLRYRGGARGILHASQISAGEENGINIRVYGNKAGLYWNQENPNYLWVRSRDGTETRYSRGNANLVDAARAATRLPTGHPEGFFEAFANVYREAFEAISAEVSGQEVPARDFPTVDDGVMGMAFIDAVVTSSRSSAKWTRLKAV